MKWMIIAVVIIGILFSIYEAKIKGFIGEKAISILINGLPEDKYRVMNNIMLRSSHGLTQVDHIIVSVYGIFVIETKNYKGWITGGENSENWTKNVFGHKYKFRNPLKQNYAHVKALMELLDITDKNVFIPVVAFSGYADLKVKTNQNVIYYGELKGLIKEHTQELLTYEQMNEYADKAYDIDYLMDAIQDYVAPIKGNPEWGYTPAYFLSARFNLHRDYAEHYLAKGDLTNRDINHILARFDMVYHKLAN